jgi:hypothetical protein
MLRNPFMPLGAKVKNTPSLVVAVSLRALNKIGLRPICARRAASVSPATPAPQMAISESLADAVFVADIRTAR